MPPHLCPKPLALDDFFAHFLIHTLKQIQDKKFGKPTLRARKGWITWTIATNGLDKQPYPNLKVVKNKIDRNKLIKEYKSKKARVPPVEVHVKIADIYKCRGVVGKRNRSRAVRAWCVLCQEEDGDTPIYNSEHFI